VVLFFDDIHWADVSTVDLLGYLAARFESIRTLILVTYRPGDLQLAKHPFLQVKLELEARRMGREVELGFLTRSDIEEYLSLQFPRNTFLAEFSRVLHDRTEGNPLFVVDLIRDLKERGVIVQEEGIWTLERAIPEIETALPKSVQSMIELKLRALRDEDRRLLVTASVQGSEFDSAVVARSVQMDAAEVEERLDELERIHGFVQLLEERELPDGTPTLVYRFVHSVYQASFYRLLTPTRRAAASRAVADALIYFHGEENPSIASHVAFLLEGARDFERGAHYFLLAARHAARILAHPERVELAERGLKLLRSVPESPARTAKELALLVVLGPAMMVTRGWAADEVETTYARARELAEKTDQRETLFHALWGLFSVRLVRAEFQPALELGKELLGVAEPIGDPSLLLQSHLAFGQTFFFLGELSKAKKHLDESRSLEPRAAAGRSRRSTMGQEMGSRTYNTWLLCLLGYPDTALETSRAAIAAVQEKKLSHPFSLAYAYWSAIALHQFRLEPGETETWSRKAVELCREHELATFWSWGAVVLGWSLVKQGRPEEGIRQMRQGLDAFRSTGAELASTYFLGLLAEAYGDDGQFPLALATVEDALAAARELGERFFQPELFRLRGELLLASDAPDRREAERSYRQAVAIARDQGSRWFELRASVGLGRLLMEEGRREEARSGLAALCDSITEGTGTEDFRRARRLLEALS
jgi:predicted ATPase